mmetsp:Transcript_168/g.658  ORF Transcript_168/g.658 Transcript_168/m.658 type:complete len:208 (-) Transcript_168:353-976(-)
MSICISTGGIGMRLHSVRQVSSRSPTAGAGWAEASTAASLGRSRLQAAARLSGAMARISLQTRSEGSALICFSTALIIFAYAGACASPNDANPHRHRAVSATVSTCSIVSNRSQYASRVHGSRAFNSAKAHSESRSCRWSSSGSSSFSRSLATMKSGPAVRDAAHAPGSGQSFTSAASRARESHSCAGGSDTIRLSSSRSSRAFAIR